MEAEQVVAAIGPLTMARPNEEKVLRKFLREWPGGVPLVFEFRGGSRHTPHSARVSDERGVALVWADTYALGEEK